MPSHHYKVMTNAFSREHLLDQGTKNGVRWEENGHEGVNWMRFSGALDKHLSANQDFHTDDADVATLKQMHDQYKQLRETHKQTMIPHVRGAMQRLKEKDTSNTGSHHTEYLQQAYAHLDANGGHHWAEKVSTLQGLNSKIKGIAKRLSDKGVKVE